MKLLFKPFNHNSLEGEWVVMIGNFDGFHLGHQALARRLTAAQRTLHTKSAILTFAPHPKQLLQPEVPFYQIYPDTTKLDLISQTGIDACLIAPFSHQFAALSATEFTERLFRYIDLKKVLVGYDFNFGKSREGSAQLFEEQCKANGVGFEMVKAVKQEGFTVSSTLIRRLLFEGDFVGAQRFLGRRWSISGEVTKGLQKGRQLGFPTINLPSEILLPIRLGVYICEVSVQGVLVSGVCNVGVKPTFEGHRLITEAHLFDFDQEIYGQQVQVYPIQFLRPEVRFGSLAELAQQIGKDVAVAKAYFQSRP